jgi:dynein assembly factor 2
MSQDGKITREELRNVLKAMDKEGFDHLMGDYIKEISNPENIKETNQYLKQAEETNDLPKNVKLAKPKAGFCLKSTKVNIKRPVAKQKVFINIVSYEGVRQPNQDPNNKNFWSLPFLINKGKNDQDKKGKFCITYDIAFHPEAIEKSKNMGFKKFVADTAINGINNNLLKENSEKISNDYVIITKYEYKGTEISYMNIFGLTKGEFDNQLEPKENYQTNLQKEIDSIKKEEPEEESVFDKPDVDIESSQKEIQALEKLTKIKPEYKIKYSDLVDLGRFFYNTDKIGDATYNKLIIDIKVSRMENLNHAELEIDEKKLIFRYKDIYELDIDLPAKINKDKSEAKFDRKNGILTISAEIVKKAVEEFKYKEDNDIEFVPYEEEVKPVKKEPVQESKPFEEAKTEILVNKSIESTNKLDESQNIKPLDSPAKLETLEINNEIKEEPIVESKIIELPAKISPQTEEDDKDDIPTNIIQQTIEQRKDVNKIVFLNFNCELIYEID